jgi:hypothetical protein
MHGVSTPPLTDEFQWHRQCENIVAGGESVDALEKHKVNRWKFFQVQLGDLIIHIIRGRNILLQRQELLILFQYIMLFTVICFCCQERGNIFFCSVLMNTDIS